MFEEKILAAQEKEAIARAIHAQAVNSGQKDHPLPSTNVLRPPGQVAAQKPLVGPVLRSKGLDRIEAMRRSQGG
jgi:hypothetical protein